MPVWSVAPSGTSPAACAAILFGHRIAGGHLHLRQRVVDRHHHIKCEHE
jgi:hypothetical protein